MVNSKKKLISPYIDSPQKTSGNFLELFKNSGKTSYQVFCPKCRHGPMFTADTGLLCERCGRKLIIARMPGGDYKIAVVE